MWDAEEERGGTNPSAPRPLLQTGPGDAHRHEGTGAGAGVGAGRSDGGGTETVSIPFAVCNGSGCVFGSVHSYMTRNNRVKPALDRRRTSYQRSSRSLP